MRTLVRIAVNLVRLEPLDLVIAAVAAAVYLPVFAVARVLRRAPPAEPGAFRPTRAAAGPRSAGGRA